MNYYLIFGRLQKNEASFKELEPKKLNFPHPAYALHQKRSLIQVKENYDERGMSDFLKKGIGLLASSKVQQIFFKHGFTGLQFLPVYVKNERDFIDYAFINPIAHYDLLDPIASEAEDFTDSLGGFSFVFDQIIDRRKFDATKIEHDCFTLSTYKSNYYVSEPVKLALEAAGITGITFIPMEFSS
ncbi:hypothetical protein ACRZ5S_20640 [Vibrio scophthalmi]|uniref:hypothetical protein n=1 Tax=Vibrio scophthalmi TaxID=45658 RepID=UPI003EB7A24C